MAPSALQVARIIEGSGGYGAKSGSPQDFGPHCVRPSAAADVPGFPSTVSARPWGTGAVSSAGESVGRWRLLRRLGTGGMGQVWLGEDPAGERAAVKLLRPEFAGDPEARQRFERKLTTARRVTSRRVAVPLDAQPGGDPPFIAWEFVEGPTLLERLHEKGPLSSSTAMRLARDLAEALRDLHAAGIIHRDVKPSNVILGDTGAVLVDLGVALFEDQTAMTSTGHLVGTPRWLTPEQLAGYRPTERSDVFNWAATVVFAATGEGPFGTQPLPQIVYRVAHEVPDLEGVSPALADLVAAALAKDPSRRPETGALARTLSHRLLSDEVATQRSPAHDRTVVTRTRGYVAPGTRALPVPGTPTELRMPRPTVPRQFRRTFPLAAGVVLLVGGVASAGLLLDGRAGSPDASSAAAPSPAPTPSITSTTPSPSSLALARPPPQVDDPAAYYTTDGTDPLQRPHCGGLLGLCLGNPIERATALLGTEDYRFEVEDNIHRTWDLGDVTLSITTDRVGSIIEIDTEARSGARISTPLDNVVVGRTTLREFYTARSEDVEADVLTGEGLTIVSLWIREGGEGSEVWEASITVTWDEPEAEALFDAPD